MIMQGKPTLKYYQYYLHRNMSHVGIFPVYTAELWGYFAFPRVVHSIMCRPTGVDALWNKASWINITQDHDKHILCIIVHIHK